MTLIRAVGVVSPFGVGLEPLARGLLAGRSAFAEDRSLLPAGAAVFVAAVSDALLAGELATVDRTLALTELALRDLLGNGGAAALDGVAPERVGVVVGSTQGAIRRWAAQRVAMRERADLQPDPPDSAAPLRLVCERLGALGPRANPSMACASGTAALAVADRWLRRGRCDAVIAGGADALSLFVRQGFAALRALDARGPRPFDAARAGLGLGEAAALLLLVRDGAGAGARGGANASASQPAGVGVLLGSGLAADANHLTGPDRDGRGVSRAVDAALRQARARGAALASAADTGEELAFVCAHGTATPYNDRMEAIGLARALGSRRPPVTSFKGALGHPLAAAGAVEAAGTLALLCHGEVAPTANTGAVDPEVAEHIDVVHGAARAVDGAVALSTSSGFGGINAAVLLGRRGSRPWMAERRADGPHRPGREAYLHRLGCACARGAGVATLRGAAHADRGADDAPSGDARAEDGHDAGLPALPGAPAALPGRAHKVRFARLDRVCKVALVAAADAFEEGPLSWPVTGRRGVSLGTAYGAHRANEQFEQTLAVDVAAGSPRLFAYTLPSTAAAELSILMQLEGPLLTFAEGAGAGLAAVAAAADAIAADEADAMLCGAVESAGETLARALPGDPAPGDGAALLWLTTQREGALARVGGWAQRAASVGAPLEEAVEAAIEAALADAGLLPPGRAALLGDSRWSKLAARRDLQFVDGSSEARRAAGRCFAAEPLLALALALDSPDAPHGPLLVVGHDEINRSADVLVLLPA